MAKLQKRSKHLARHSVSTESVKLTPAEIRAQNNLPPASKPSSRKHSSDHVRRARQLDHSTPPQSPDKAPKTAYEKQVRRSSTTPLPTPPHSPVFYYAKTINSQALPPNFSMPRSHASVQADQLVTSAMSSRRSSVSSSRNLPTYRGAQMTRTGSFTLLQRPSQQIVGNPLSNFSRPRRSGSASPARSNLSIDANGCDHDEVHYQRRGSFTHSVSAASDTPTDVDNLEPPERNVSPISFEANQSIRDFSIVRDGVVISGAAVAPSISSSAGEEAQIGTAMPMSVARMDSAQALRENRHQHATLSSKLRRHTMPVSGIADASAYTAQKAREEDEPTYGPHPGVRPLTVAIPPTSILKGKQRESYSAPIVRCCHKCGRHKKPSPGDADPLSPVLEHPKVAGLKGEGEMNMSGGVASDQPVPVRNPRRSSGTGNIGVKWEDSRAEGKIRPVPPPTIMRFASLRGYTTESEEVQELETNGGDKDYLGDGTRSTNANANEREGQSPVEGPVKSDSLRVTGSAAESVKSHDSEFVMAHEQQPIEAHCETTSTAGNADAGHLSPPVQKPWQPLADSVSASESESEAEARKRGVKIPRPTLEPRFARSNQTLRDLVVPRGSSVTNLLDSVSAEKEVVGGRPSPAPHETIGKMDGGNQGESATTGHDFGDIFRGLEMSKSIDEMRQQHAIKVAEIMAV